METKIFGRLTAWQNWIFQRPNAIGEQGALNATAAACQPTFNEQTPRSDRTQCTDADRRRP